MSHKPYIGLLAHHEPRDARPTSFIPADQADFLLEQLAAEPISQRVIRMLPPDSVFFAFSEISKENPRSCAVLGSLPAVVQISGLPPTELPGLRFQPPADQRFRHVLNIPIVKEAWQNWRAQLATA